MPQGGHQVSPHLRFRLCSRAFALLCLVLAVRHTCGEGDSPRAHPDDVAAAVRFRTPHIVAGSATELAITAVGLAQGVTYRLRVLVARGGDVVHIDESSVTWSREMASASGDVHVFTHPIPPLSSGPHTVRATLLDAAAGTEEEAELASMVKSITDDSNPSGNDALRREGGTLKAAVAKTAPQPLLCLVLPFRDGCGLNGFNRTRQLDTFLDYMTDWLQSRGHSEFRFVVSEQSQRGLFNKGLLFNLGSVKAFSMGCEYVVFHDIDQLPTNPENNYQVHRAGPLHMCTNTTQYTELGSVDLQPHVGGALMMSRRDYIRVNGFSNRYWRWGHENSDMMHRINTVLKTLSRLPQSVGTYLENKHPRMKFGEIKQTAEWHRSKEYLGISRREDDFALRQLERDGLKQACDFADFISEETSPQKSIMLTTLTIDLQRELASQCTDADANGNKVIVESQRRQRLEWRGRCVSLMEQVGLGNRVSKDSISISGPAVREMMTKTTDHRQEMMTETVDHRKSTRSPARPRTRGYIRHVHSPWQLTAQGGNCTMSTGSNTIVQHGSTRNSQLSARHGLKPKIRFYSPPSGHEFDKNETVVLGFHGLVAPTEQLWWQSPSAVWLFWQVILEVNGVEVGRWGATWLTDKEGNLEGDLGLSVRVLSGDLGDTRRRHWAYVTVAPGVVTNIPCQNNSMSVGCPGRGQDPADETSGGGNSHNQEQESEHGFGHGIIFFT